MPAGERILCITGRMRPWPPFLLALLLLFTPHTPLFAASGGPAREPHDEAESEPVTHEEPTPAPAAGARGILDKPLKVKGVEFRFGGFANVDILKDLDPIGNEYEFQVDSIPVDNDPNADIGGNLSFSARQTRFSLDVRGNTTTGLVRGYVEGDFSGSGGSFRLRHGYGEWQGILGGQTWTTFMDISVRPSTLDYEGPDTEVHNRQPLVRYTRKPSKMMEWSVAAEDPSSEITAGTPGSDRSEYPDVPARVRFEPEWGHVQIAGILKQLRFVSNGGGIDETAAGYGLNLTGAVHPTGKDRILWQVTLGRGIARYMETFRGTGSDGVITAGGDLEAIGVVSTLLAYARHWTDRLRSTFSGGIARLEEEPDMPGTAIRQSRSAHANLIFSPNRLIDFGGEVMWGQRRDMNGFYGHAVRIQLSARYRFR